ncbi:MAG: glycosyltransferase [Candidatus Berkelbacteria bacterium]
MPKISFLIATFNRADKIGETIKSLLAQDDSSWEAIIVDNGSDNTREIVENFHDSRLRYFYLSKVHGTGASCARNFACMQAKSEIVAILDSDDLAYKNRVSETLKFFDRDSTLDFFYSDFHIWYEKTGEIKDRNFPVYDYSFEKIKEINFIPHSTVAMRKQVLLDNPYNQFFKIAEDYDLFTRLAIKNYKFASSKEKLLKYRVAEDNISIGNKNLPLVSLYLKLVKMTRGWAEFDENILVQIEKMEEGLND